MSQLDSRLGKWHLMIHAIHQHEGENSIADHPQPEEEDLLGDTEAHPTWSDPACALGQD